MLRVVQVCGPDAPAIVVDDYIPLALEWRRFAPPSPVYWRATPDDRSLIEVGLHPQTGCVCSMTIVLPGADVELLDGVFPAAARPEERGHPVCDLAPWAGDWLLDDAVPFRIAADDRSVGVWFTSPEEAEVDLVSGPVHFHLSAERRIVGFSVPEFPPGEAARLKETLRWIRRTAGTRLLHPEDGG